MASAVPSALVFDVRLRSLSDVNVKAEALREAADELYGDNGPGNPLSTATWLRERADRIEGNDR